MSASKKHIPVEDLGGKKHRAHHEQETDAQESAAAALAPDGEASEPRTDTGELAERVQQLEKENTGLLDRLQRSLAEFDNYRKRVSREKDDLTKYANEKMALDLLPVVDNFERALEQAEQATDISSVTQGIAMIYRQLLSTLEKYQIKPFASVGEQFTPEKHEAMMHQEHPEYDENTVMAELQKGYYLENKLLRAARVIVSRGQGNGAPDEG